MMRFIISLAFCVFSNFIFTQNTVGLLSYDVHDAFEGYSLFFSHNQSTVYLINNCGEIVHQWEDDSDFRPGNAVYLLENGDLLKCKRKSTSTVMDPIWAGGGGETIELRSWDNELIASITQNDSIYRFHHDVEPLPSGNVLIISWEYFDKASAIAAGRDTALLPQDKLWSEAIFEWDPYSDSIVWEWHAWDHLIQDYDRLKDNFGSISAHPEKININYEENDALPDWLHINSIAYNPILDQIVLSVPHFNEFWIIDHSTTTEEARSDFGGRSGVGGDLLMRWGNPRAADQVGDQTLYFQHDVKWVKPDAVSGDVDFGKISFFNNRVTGSLSLGSVIKTEFDTTTRAYSLLNGYYVPETIDESFVHPDTIIESYSNSVSSFQILPNNNKLLCAGRWGYAYELNSDNEITWEYRVPLKAGSPVSQGESLEISDNLTFRIEKYPADYPAFRDRDLSTQGYVENDPNVDFCNDLATSTIQPVYMVETLVSPNPTSDMVTISTLGFTDIYDLYIYDIHGFLIYFKKNFRKDHDIQFDFSGVYWALGRDWEGNVIFQEKIIVQK